MSEIGDVNSVYQDIVDIIVITMMFDCIFVIIFILRRKF